MLLADHTGLLGVRSAYGVGCLGNYAGLLGGGPLRSEELIAGRLWFAAGGGVVLGGLTLEGVVALVFLAEEF